jgi:chromosome partitioning protein
MKVTATYSIKGGVGKTSTAVNLAALAAEAGHRTLLWDLDPQGAATFLFRVRPKVKGGGKGLVKGTSEMLDAVKATDLESLDLLPADFSYRNLDLALDGRKDPTRHLRRLLATVEDDYDLVVLDCAPSASLVSENVIRTADLLVVPLIPAPLSIRTLDQLVDFVASVPGRSPEILAFLSMIDRRRSLHRQIGDELSLRPQTSAAQIPYAAAVEMMGVERRPLVVAAPRQAAARAYRVLWGEVADQLWPAKGVSTPGSTLS